jgi:outer membrane receptor protein involved in Fe transport
MKPIQATPPNGRRLSLLARLALLSALATTGHAATADELQQLRAELEALRAENAALKQRYEPSAAPANAAPAPTAAPTTQPSSSSSSSSVASTTPRTEPQTTDPDTLTLSVFSVTGARDNGYLKTNSATATRVGMEIQKVPFNVSVMSREFLEDTNSRSLMDILRYTSGASGDTRFAMRRPGNEATPQGGFTMRGFPVNTLMRNGVFRYVAYNLDNVERVEVVKGPAAVFFGQGYPGGVINYITKQPSFSKIPNTVRYTLSDNNGQKVVSDFNLVLNDKTALRFIGAWEDAEGERRFEFRKNHNLTPSLTFVPFESGKLKINLDFEYLNETFSQNDYEWIWSDFAGWKAAAAGGPIQANSINTPSLTYTTYINNKRIATGDYTLPAYTSVERGAYYTDAQGNFARDEEFNYTSRGAQSTNRVTAFTARVDFAPVEWMDARYVFQRDNSRFNSIEGVTTPYADGIHWNVGAAATSGYYRLTNTHELDLVFKFETKGIKHKFLTGYSHSQWTQNYLANDIRLTPFYGFVPGATNPIANPGYVPGTTGGSQVAGNLVGEGRGHDTGVPTVNQVVRDRNGNIKLVRAVYSDWDPGFETSPPINKLFPIDRVWLDGYKPTVTAAYANHQASFFEDRLNVIAGVRRQWREEKGQYLESNYPWFVVPVDAHLDPATYPEDVWGYSGNYARTNIYKRKGDSWMGGASFAITPNINVYASISKTFQFNLGNVGGVFTGNEIPVIQSALAHGGGSFEYLGQTVTSVEQAQQIMTERGAYEPFKDETGMNWEVGAKISTDDQKIVGTISFFRGERKDQRLDDPAKQSNIEEPFNYSTRNFRWRTADLKNRIEGSEVEVIWSPKPNLQLVTNASWLWTAKTIYDRTRPAPGSDAYNALAPAGKVASDIYYGARIENVPEYRFNVFGKYTFVNGPLREAAVGGGMRYSSETVISRTVDWNPLAGGYQAGDYVVFDATFSYPWKVMGFRLVSTLGIYNVTDEDYSEGSFVLTPKRNWVISNTLQF